MLYRWRACGQPGRNLVLAGVGRGTLAVGMLAVIVAAWNYEHWAAYTIVLAYSCGAFVFLAQGDMMEFAVAAVLAGVGIALFTRQWACIRDPP